MTDPVFQVDQKITPLYTSGYAITMGKEYTVLKYEPAVRDAEFTWPPWDSNSEFRNQSRSYQGFALCH